jgi:oleandomycin transport system ATP-binding protein
MNTHYGSDEIAVRVEGLVKRFGEKAAVDHVDFAVRAGSVFGLLGPNGAGKTTIVRMLSTLTRPDGGTATVAGLDVVKHAQAVRRVIGLTGQFAAVDETLSGYENIYMIGRLLDMPAKQAKQRAGELLAAFDLADDAKKPAKQYSGGMRRRLDLAASLVGRPAVLFLDEPTTGLDPARRNDLWEIVRDLTSTGTTVLLTTQYMEEAEALAQDIVVMNDGRFIARGTAEELKVRIAGRSIRLRPIYPAELPALREVVREVLGKAEDVAPGTVGGPITEDSQVALLLRSIAARDLAIADISTVTASLDEVFLALTEKKPAAPADGPLDAPAAPPLDVPAPASAKIEVEAAR